MYRIFEFQSAGQSSDGCSLTRRKSGATLVVSRRLLSAVIHNRRLARVRDRAVGQLIDLPAISKISRGGGRMKVVVDVKRLVLGGIIA